MSVTSSDPEILRRCPLWVKLVLVLSLSANLVVAGLYIGIRMRAEPTISASNWLERRILSSLPEAKRDAAIVVFEARGAELAELREMRLTLREQAAEILEAKEYDAEALLAVFDKRQLASSALFALYYERVAVLATELSPEERVALSAGLLRRVRRPRN